VDSTLAPFYGLLTRPVQRARLRVLERHLAGAGRVLDVGCGLTDLPGRLPSYVGCDRNPTVLTENRRRFPQARFVDWDVSASAAPPELAAERFDLALMAAVLEHLADPGAAMGRVASLLAPGGRLLATTPHPIGRTALETGAALGLLSRSADEEHETLLDRAALERAGASAGLTMTDYGRFLLGMNQVALFRKAP